MSKFTISNFGFPGIEVDRVPSKVKDDVQTNTTENIMVGWSGAAWAYGATSLTPCPQGVIETYRWMEEHPTLTLAKGVVSVPVVGAPYGWEADKRVSDKRVEVIKNCITPLLHQLVYDMIDSLSYRWQPFEVVWGFDADKWHVPVMFKPLRQELTFPLIRKSDKQYVGLQNLDVELFGANAFTFCEKPQYGTVIGKSRHEAARQHAWWPWIRANLMSEKLDKKATGIVFAVKGPTHSQFKGADGNYVSGQQASLNLANMLQQGISVYMPNRIVSAKSIDQIKELAKVSDFEVQYFDLGDTSGSNETILNKMRYYDSCMFRAWRRPERSALEGQKGTLAEAEAHGDVGMGDSELLRTFIAGAINKGIIDNILVENWGEKARGTVRLKPAPVTDGRFVVLKMLMDRMAQYPEIISEIVKNSDMDQVFDVLGIPKKKSLIEFPELKIQSSKTSGQPGNPNPSGVDPIKPKDPNKGE